MQLLAKEEELTLHEEAIVVQEKGLEVSEQALGKVSLELSTEWVKTKAIVQYCGNEPSDIIKPIATIVFSKQKKNIPIPLIFSAP
jgi:hypothetical protein